MENQLPVKLEKDILIAEESLREGAIHFFRYDQIYGTQIGYVTHWHSEYEIVYVLDRYLDFIADGRFYHLLPGQALLIHRDTIHGHADVLEEYGSYLAFAFGEEFLFPDPQSCLYKQYYLPFLLGEKMFSGCITGENDGEREILSVVQELLPLSQDISANALQIHICLLRIFEVVSRQPAAAVSVGSLRKRESMNAALSYINRNFTKNISVDELSRLLYMNADYFRRVFRSVIGCTPKEYIQNLRIRYAIGEMTAHPEKPLSEVAAQSGFSEINYFSRLFRNKTGMSPTAYRSRRTENDIKR